MKTFTLLSLAVMILLSADVSAKETTEKKRTVKLPGVITRHTPEENALSRVISKAMPSVVLITAQKRVGVVSFDYFYNGRVEYKDVPRGQGSGFFVESSGYIVTNFHVVRNHDSFWVTLHDGREFAAELHGTDPASDLAVLKIKNPGKNTFPVLSFADEKGLAPGQRTIAIGAPFSLNQTVTTGIISGLNRTGVGIHPYENYIQTDASINMGNSGGPLLDSAGNVIGVNDFIMSPSGGNIGLSFAISCGIARKIVEDLINHSSVRRGFLGIAYQLAVKEQEFHRKFHGIFVERVFAGTPAAGKLLRGDQILGANGKRFTQKEDFANLLFGSRPGATLTLTILRNGKKITQKVTLGKKEERKGPYPLRKFFYE